MEKLIVTSSPHIHTKTSTATIMRDVLISLLPASIAAVIFFGLNALLLIFTCVASAIFAEYLFNAICKKKQTVGDLSAVVTGLLLALNLSAKVELWQAALGSAFAIIVVKCLFGGIGCNFANPAIAGRVFLIIAFGSVAGGAQTLHTDIIASATPLEVIKNGSGDLPTLLDMFIGNRGGAIGETCVLALLLGFVYLLVRRVISWHTPVVFILTVFLISLTVKQDFNIALYELMGGGLFIGAIFMATDYVTTPAGKTGKLIFGLGCGIITVLIRFWGSYPEGVSFAILFMNILTPYIDKIKIRRPLGGVKNVQK